jgi:hypothetical protein
MRIGVRRALVVAGAGAVLAALPVAATGTTASRGVCDAHRVGAKLVTRSVVVFGKHTGKQTDNGPETAYFACLRPRGARVRLGYDAPDDGVYGSDETTGAFRAAGTYVAVLSSTGGAAASVCSKYAQPNCPMPRRWIRVAETRFRRAVDFDVHATVTTVVLSPAGAVAWLEYTQTTATSSSYALHATALHAKDARHLTGSPTEIDTGAIDRHSLRFDGLTLRWMRDGQPHSQTLT